MPGPSVSVLSWLRPERIQVAYAGTVWDLTAVTAADWLGAVAIDYDSLSGVFPGLICDQQLDEITSVMYDLDQMRGATEVARSVIQAAGGRDWWWTVNLIKRAVTQWMYVNGFLVRQGVRVDSTALPDWLDACYTWLWERADENQRAALDMELSMLPKGVRGKRADMKKMLEAFQAD